MSTLSQSKQIKLGPSCLYRTIWKTFEGVPLWAFSALALCQDIKHYWTDHLHFMALHLSTYILQTTPSSAQSQLTSFHLQQLKPKAE